MFLGRRLDLGVSTLHLITFAGIPFHFLLLSYSSQFPNLYGNGSQEVALCIKSQLIPEVRGLSALTNPAHSSTPPNTKLVCSEITILNGKEKKVFKEVCKII